MDKSKKAKLVEFRQKKVSEKRRAEDTKHAELLQAVKGLHDLFSSDKTEDKKHTDELLDKLAEFNSFKEELLQVQQAIKNLPKVDNVAISNIEELVAAQHELDLTEVITALKELSGAVNARMVDSMTIKNKKPDDFIPVRRVREVRGRLLFDDDPLQVTVVGGGVGTLRTSPYSDSNDKSAFVVLDAGKVPVTDGFQVLRDFDYLHVSNSGANEDTLTYKLGGSSGSTARTIVMTYASGAEKVSDSISTLEYS